jgi:chaperonin cofactor prefoldin
MSRVRDEAGELLESLLADRSKLPASLEEIDAAIERIEELSKLAQSDEDEAYLSSVGEALLELRSSRLAKDA